MRKTICALALTLILYGTIFAGEMPNGGTPPPPPPPPPPVTDDFGEMPNGRAVLVQTTDPTVKDYILTIIQNVLTLY